MDTSTVLKPEDFLPYFQMLEEAKAGPAKLLLKTLGLIEADKALSDRTNATPPLAVDLGCGTGKDTAELLRRNWRVLAIDYSQTGIDTLLARPEASQYKTNLETRVSSFADTSWGPANLVAALLTLPYGPAETFDAVWQSVVSSLVPGGYFVGQLFGPDHYKGMNHVVRRSRAEVDTMLASLQVLHLEEINQVIEHEGEKTYFHYFEIIARNPAIETQNANNETNTAMTETRQKARLEALETLRGVYALSMKKSQSARAAAMLQINEVRQQATQAARKIYDTTFAEATAKLEAVVGPAQQHLTEVTAPALKTYIDCTEAAKAVCQAARKLATDAYQLQIKQAEDKRLLSVDLAQEIYEVALEDSGERADGAEDAWTEFRASTDRVQAAFALDCEAAQKTCNELQRLANEELNLVIGPARRTYDQAIKADVDACEVITRPEQTAYHALTRAAWDDREAAEKAASLANQKACEAIAAQYAVERRARVRAWNRVNLALEDLLAA